jgi:hypothetical protein
VNPGPHRSAALLSLVLTSSAFAAPRELPEPPPIDDSKRTAVKTFTSTTSARSHPKRRKKLRAPGVPPARPSIPTAETVPQGEAQDPAIEEIAPAASVEEAPAAPAPPARKVRFSFHGYVLSRATAALLDDDAAFAGIYPTQSSPRAYVEVDLQPSLSVLGSRLHLYSDLTLYIASAEPKYLFLPNELYVESRVVGPLYLLAGRRRVVWGSGLAANPTDLINPVKNPLDVEQQRAGAFLFPLVEVVTKWITLSALVAPSSTFNRYGLPTGLDFTQPLVAARLYFLVKGTDVNLMYFYDHARRRHQGGLSLARYFVDKVEVHAEALAHQGASDLPPVPIVPACGEIAPAFGKASGSVIAGGRLDLADQTFLSAEYYFRGDGFDHTGYDQYRTASPCTRAALAALPSEPGPQPGHPIDPVFFLLRQHYLALTFVRPHLTAERLEKIALSASAIWSLEDLSLVLQARVAYKIFDQGTLGLLGATWVGPRMSEFWSTPTRAVAQVDLKMTF